MTHNKLFPVLLIAFFSAVLAASIYMLTRESAEYIAGDQVYEELSQYTFTAPKLSEHSAPITDEDSSTHHPTIDFNALREINPDIVAWLICEDTVINYPVVRGSNNEYYLRHLFDGTRNKAGCLFVDSGNTPGFMDHNTVIYGHNLKSGRMFSVLMKYKKQTFYDAHPQMELLTPAGNYTIELFAGYVADTRGESWELQFPSDAEFEEWILDAKKKSTFQSSAACSIADRFITLSTCSNEFDDARYIVVGRLLPQSSVVSQNPR